MSTKEAMAMWAAHHGAAAGPPPPAAAPVATASAEKRQEEERRPSSLEEILEKGTLLRASDTKEFHVRLYTLPRPPPRPPVVCKVIRHPAADAVLPPLGDNGTATVRGVLHEAAVTHLLTAAPEVIAHPGAAYLLREVWPALTVRSGTNGYTVLFLEYASGGDLFDWAAAERSAARSEGRPYHCPEAFLRRVAHHLVLGLLAMKQGAALVHRDVKLENVLLFREAKSEGHPTAVLCDFATALSVDRRRPPTVLEQRVERHAGTGAYLSPEAVQRHKAFLGGRAPLDYDLYAADVYALGVLLAFLATGRLLFSHADAAVDELYRRNFSSAARRERTLLGWAPALSAEGRAFVLACTQPEVERPTLEALLSLPWLSSEGAASAAGAAAGAAAGR